MASTVWDVLSAPEKRLVGRDLGSFACALALAFGSSLLGLLPDHRVQVQTWLGPFLAPQTASTSIHSKEEDENFPYLLCYVLSSQFYWELS